MGEAVAVPYSMAINEETYTGDYLMKIGLPVLTASEGTSHVLELTAEN